jgi:hypothetical protein
VIPTDRFARIPELDAAVSEWFSKRGTPITERHWDGSSDIFSWRHDTGRAADRRTLKITRVIAEDFSADQLILSLDRHKASELLNASPDGSILLQRCENGRLCVNGRPVSG